MNTAVRPAPPLPPVWIEIWIDDRRETAPAARHAKPRRFSLLRPAAGSTLAVLFSAWCCLPLGGCGSPGSPQPPSLKLPSPPADLSASRSGDSVTLHWTMPRRATDRVPLIGDQRVVICRAAGAAMASASGKTAPCDQVGSLLLSPGLPAAYLDPLPASLVAGRPRLLTYTVLLENHKQRSAGPSNPAFTVAGAAPPALLHLRAEASAAGIVLRWDDRSPALDQVAGRTAYVTAQVHYLLRLHRTRLAAPGESLAHGMDASAGVPQPVEQTLEVPEEMPGASAAAKPSTLALGWRLDHAIDQDAALNHSYRYTAERVARLVLDGHAVEVSGSVAGPVTIEARDVFPPGVPQGLQAVADSEGGAIDLSWSPDADRDLAGYRVYRRALDPAGGAGEPKRISGADLLRDPAWRDPGARPRVRYAYSVSAVDSSGNESARCPEVEEMLELAAP